MHYLDSIIDDIEPRIESIISTSPTVSDATIQTSLISYCWILLDSWVAWNTYRYLLRDSIINQDIPEKWIRSPSSYTYSQLQSIWKFGTKACSFFSDKTGDSLKKVIDEVIQKHRNASAHFSRDMDQVIRGDDLYKINNYFSCLSRLFRFVEIKKLLEKINNQLLLSNEVVIDNISFSSGQVFLLKEYDNYFMEFVGCNDISCRLSNNLILLFEKETRNSFLLFDGSKMIISSSSNSGYNVFGSKGFYLDIEPIISMANSIEKETI